LENYLKALELLKKLLSDNKEPFWADWMQKDIDEWKNMQSTEHHLNAFGGAGSFNDVNLNYEDNLGYWKNTLMSNLASISYGFAKDRSFNLPDNSSTILDGSVCQKCKNVVINENTITRFLAGKFILIFLAEYFLTDSYLTLLDLEKLVLDTRIEVFKNELLQEVIEKNMQINYQNSAWTPNCASCNATEKVYWEFSPKLA
jgi:hypothetical protein